MNRIATVLAVLAIVLFACAPKSTDVTSAVSRDQATAMAEYALVEGFNRGRYEAWSRDWTDAMRAAIGADAFQAFRRQAFDQVGEFRTIRETRLVQGRSPGYVRWEFVCDFEKATMVLAYGFQHEGTKVEGVFFDAASAAER